MIGYLVGTLLYSVHMAYCFARCFLFGHTWKTARMMGSEFRYCHYCMKAERVKQ